MNKRIPIIIILLVLAVFAVACSSSKNSDSHEETTEVTFTPTPTIPPCPEEVTITNEDISFVLVGEDVFFNDNDSYTEDQYVDLKYVYFPSDTVVTVVEWSSSDDSVAVVDENGRVSPVGEGECEISLHVTDGVSDGAWTTVNVSVEDKLIVLEDQDVPNYDELLAAVKALPYGNSGIYVANSWGWKYFSTEDYYSGPRFYCVTEGDLSGIYPIALAHGGVMWEDGLQSLLGKDFIYCQNDKVIIIVQPNHTYVLCEDYGYVMDTEASLEELAELGFPDVKSQIDVNDYPWLNEK